MQWWCGYGAFRVSGPTPCLASLPHEGSISHPTLVLRMEKEGRARDEVPIRDSTAVGLHIRCGTVQDIGREGKG